METREGVACTANVEGATLSAWRDGALPPADLERVHAHVTGCSACQARLAQYDEVARMLQRQRELEPGDRIVEAVRRTLAHEPPRPWTPSRRTWGALGAIASVAAVIALFVTVLATGPLGHVRPRSAATVVPTAMPTSVPTIGPSAFTPTVPLQDAWGSSAAIAQVSTQLDATHVFMVSTGVETSTPDGHKLLGSMSVLDTSGRMAVSTQAGILDVATRQFTGVGDRITGAGAAPAFPLASCDSSDGRFVICSDQAKPSPASVHAGENPLGPIKVWSYDLMSGQARFLVDNSQYPFEGVMPVSHGVLVLWGGSGFGLVNLTTATLSQLSLPARAPIGLGFSWPYLVYADHPDLGGPITVRAHDLATGADRALPQVDALYAAANTGGANHQPYLALAGDTLFVSLATGRIQSSSIPPNNVTGPDAATTLYEMDHLFAAGAQLRPVARYHGVAESPVGANDRLVVFGFVAWDRAQDRFVTYPPPPPDGLEPPAALSGNALTLTTQTVSATGSWVAEQVTIYDTALLRTAGS